MRAAILHAAQDIRIENVPRPVPGEGEALIEIRATGICGSDLHRYRGRDPWSSEISFPRQDGHEMADRTILGGRDNSAEHIDEATGGRGADVVFECAGGASSATVKPPIELVIPRGRIGILGAFVGDVCAPYQLANRKEITLTFCNGYATWQGRREFRMALDLIAAKSINTAYGREPPR